jgi:cell division protease FtsH
MKKGLIILIIVAMLIYLWLRFISNQNLKILPNWQVAIEKINDEEKVNLNKFINLYKQNKFEKIEVIDNTLLKGYEKVEQLKQNLKSMTFQKSFEIPEIIYNVYKTYKPANTNLKDLGISLTGNTKIIVKYTHENMLQKIFIDQIVPMLFFIFLLILVFKLAWWWGKWILPFWINIWKLKTKEEVKTTFKDVAWLKEAKEELKEIVDYLKNPQKYLRAWARIPKGVLLYWPPGTWKTLLARAVAGEAGVPFFAASWSEFMEMLVWMWAAKVRELFNKAKAAAPSIIFIDEIDTIWKKRWLWYTGWHQEQEQTLNQILTEMDWFDKDTNVIVMAATNRPDILDPALLRPGRFDRKIYVWRPTLEERLEILKLHLKDKKVADDVDLETLARRTSWFVWADLANLVNEAALKAAREDRVTITMDDLEYALEKLVMLPEKKIKSIKEDERKKIAYHELWHAVTAYHLPNTDPVEKISIVSRWLALWVTWMMPKEDRYLYSKAKFLDELVSLLWWRAAEEVFFWKDEITTWAANDFEKATKIATDMVMKYWMDEELGPVLYYDQDKWEWLPFKPFSGKTNELIDQKVKELLKNAYEKAKKILKDNAETIHKLAKILLEKEYLTKEEFEEIMKNPKKADEILEKIKKNKKENNNN